MEKTLNYPTHKLVVESLLYSQYVKVTNYVLGSVYDDMVTTIIMGSNFRYQFVKHERILLNNFFRSLLSCHFLNTVNIKASIPQFHVFSEEIDYYQFCVDNGLKFNEQEWFKTAYIKADFEDVVSILTNASATFIFTFYPEYSYSVRNVSVDYTKLFPESPFYRYKCNPENYKAFLEDNNINCLYHFSDRRNLSSIKNNGLCSLRHLTQKGISVHHVSSADSREIDEYNNLSDYIHLSYERSNPMMHVALAEGRLSDYVIIKVSTDVLFWNETKYTHCNAAKSGAIISDDISYIKQIPFKNFHNKRYDSKSQYRDYYMSEVLVKDHIPIEYID